MIAAVAGVMLTPDDAKAVLGALELLETLLHERRDQRGNPTPSQPSARLRMLISQLRRAAAKTGASPPGASQSDRNASGNARNPLLQSNSAHDAGYATFSSAQAAAVLGITANGVRDLRRRGCLRAERIGGRWRFNAAEVEARAAQG